MSHLHMIIWLKRLIWLCAFLPIMRLIWLGMHDGLTANPVEFIERSTGTWALVFLLASLCVTPIRVLFKQSWITQTRRLLGLWMFAYACLHVTTYIWLDYGFDVDSMYSDIVKHPYVLVGATAFLITIPLAITSNQNMIKRLKSRWKILHRLVYLIAVLAVVHFWWLVKKDVSEPSYYALMLAALLLIRIYHRYKIGKSM